VRCSEKIVREKLNLNIHTKVKVRGNKEEEGK